MNDGKEYGVFLLAHHPSHFAHHIRYHSYMTLPVPLQTEFVLEARVTCDSPIVVGTSKQGKRQLIPITGGEFNGPSIKGRVLPGGADWQLVRPDGVTEIEARYAIQTDDGINISVVNRGIALYPPAFEQVYVRTTPEFEAPSDSAYAWLNEAIFVGTVQVASKQPLVVLVRVYKLL
jgi:hypothetical protein